MAGQLSNAKDSNAMSQWASASACQREETEASSVTAAPLQHDGEEAQVEVASSHACGVGMYAVRCETHVPDTALLLLRRFDCSRGL